MPSFNHADYIEKAIESVVSQTYSNWELIVVDNYSTDSTDEVLSKFKSNQNIKIVKNHNFGIIANSRNIGIKESNGDWIAFLDSDDWWTPDKLFASLTYMDKYDIIYHPLVRTTGDKVLGTDDFSRQVNTNVTNDLLQNNNAIANSSVIIRKELISLVGKLDEDKDLVSVEDYDLWIRLSQVTNKFKMICRNLGYYRVVPNSMSSINLLAAQESILLKYKHLINKKLLQYKLSDVNYYCARFIAKQDRLKALNRLKKGTRFGSFYQRSRSLLYFLLLKLNII
jgi:glycosyltransferase involved in cell wall biosynthesis